MLKHLGGGGKNVVLLCSNGSFHAKADREVTVRKAKVSTGFAESIEAQFRPQQNGIEPDVADLSMAPFKQIACQILRPW